MDIWVWIYEYSMDPSNVIKISSTFLESHQFPFKFRLNCVNISEISSKLVHISSKIRPNVRFQGLPAGCVCVVAACGASATSEKTRPGFLEHVSCGFGRYLENFVAIRTGGTRVQGLGEPPGTRWGNRWIEQPEGIPY